MRRFLIALLAVVFAIDGTRTTTAVAEGCTYDAPTVSRADVHQLNGFDAEEAQLSAAREGSASLPVGARGTSTTPQSRSVATEAAGELRPAVIGEGMPNRVVPYAEQNGYVTYPGVENPASYTYDELLAHNRAQIETWTGEGRTIIDIGPEPGRAYYPMETSPNYGMEHNIVRGYPGYQPTVLPGESNWMVSHVR
ncbi:MAG: hypothetical protein Q7V57_07115 [Actinomycetota bacterium]|nr:hypothetical protein [Actinomycetota bacterium]